MQRLCINISLHVPQLQYEYSRKCTAFIMCKMKGYAITIRLFESMFNDGTWKHIVLRIKCILLWLSVYFQSPTILAKSSAHMYFPLLFSIFISKKFPLLQICVTSLAKNVGLRAVLNAKNCFIFIRCTKLYSKKNLLFKKETKKTQNKHLYAVKSKLLK